MAHKPAPFSRPSVSIGSTVTRRWVEVPVDNLSVGDIVQDHGKVVVMTPVFPSSSGLVQVEFLSGISYYTSPQEVVYAFTEGAPVGHSE